MIFMQDAHQDLGASYRKSKLAHYNVLLFLLACFSGRTGLFAPIFFARHRNAA
jgi:hypothetical protein